MRCKEVRSVVDEIGDLDRLPVEAARHVGSCGECERNARELVALRALLREPGRVAVTPDFDLALARRIRATKSPARERAGLGAWFAFPMHSIATAAAVALLAFGTFAVYEVSRPTNATSVPSAAAPSPATVATNTTGPTAPPVLPPTTTNVVAPGTGPVTPPVLSSNVRAKRPPVVREDAAPSEAMMLISDGRGTRVVSVPTVLVGSERVLPSNASAALPTPAGVSF